MLVLSRWWFHIFFTSTPYLGKWSNLTNIFQMGWNHQLHYWCILTFIDGSSTSQTDGLAGKSLLNMDLDMFLFFFWSIFQLDARMTVWQWKTRRFVFCLLRIVYIVCSINVKYFIAQRDSPFIFGFCVTPTANSIEFGSCNSNLGWLYYSFFCLIPLCKSLCNLEHPCLFGSLRPG